MSETWSYRLVWGDEEFELPTGEVTVGRSRSCDVSVAEPSVSRRHVSLEIEKGEAVLRDLGSSNGTFVDGGRVRDTARLEDGSELRLGDARMRLEIRKVDDLSKKREALPTARASVAESAPPMAAPPAEAEETPWTERETTQLAEERGAEETPEPDEDDESSELLPSIDDVDLADEAAAEGPEGGPSEPKRDSRPASSKEPADREPALGGAVMVASDAARPTWKLLLAGLGSAFLGAILLIAAWTKMIDPASFARQIETEGLDFLLPSSQVALIAVGLEVLLGLLLLLLVRRLPVLLASTGLVVFFLYLTGRTWWLAERGELPADVGCGCFGNLVQRTPAEAFWQDLLLLVPALLLAWWARPRSAGFPARRTILAVLLTAGAIGFTIRAPELPLDDLATRLRPGVAIAEICAGSDETRTCLDGVAPELQAGEHLVVLSALDESLTENVPRLDEYHLSGAEPGLMVLAAVTPEELFAFQFGQGASFEIHEAPGPLLRPLYRTLPRSFRVVDGRVVETWSGWPPVLEAPEGDG